MLRYAKAVGFGLLLLFILGKIVDWLVELLWFSELGFESVFWTYRLLKVGLFAAVFALVFAYVWFNLRVLVRHVDAGGLLEAGREALEQRLRALSSILPPPASSAFSVGLLGTWITSASAVVAALFGAVFYTRWDNLLRFAWAQPFGEPDPIFGQDLGFYVFQVPFLESLQNGALVLSFLMLAAVSACHLYGGTVKVSWREGAQASRPVLRHVAINGSLFLTALAWGFYLDRYALLQSTLGVVHGAGYTDIHAVRPALWIAMGATLTLALAFQVPRVIRDSMAFVVTVGGYMATLAIGLWIVPWGVQTFVVRPNELELETPYLEHNIRLTRHAFGIDQVEERAYSGVENLIPEDLARNAETIDNIRLWDWRPISQTFRQLQQIRSYYAFNDVDVDRYVLDGRYRQVMVSARELADALPEKADTWVNRHLQYTHGYGLVMGLAAKKTDDGTPVLVVQDVPPRTKGGLQVDQPAIYYGERLHDFRIVRSGVKEFDHPKGDANVYSRYRGTGGIPLDATWKKLLFAWHQFDLSILLTSYITDDSRLQLWRAVQRRVGRIAPFLQLDRDPYIVLAEGRLMWVQDAYTLSSDFPYSDSEDTGFNYIRNSVKAVVDAYNGAVTFYVMDADDPVLGVYRAAMPDLFRPLADMSEDLKAHLRYPLDLFQVQMTRFSTYHMTVPQVFYNGEDLWAVPRDTYGGMPSVEYRYPGLLSQLNAERKLLQPYYVLMRLAGEERAQFILMSPLSPANRDNMIAWMAARSDFPEYGRLLVYKLPKERLILGPVQIEAMIDQDTKISQQISLWDQRGSRVIRGSLLVVPIEQSFIYVKPIYLVAEGTDIPQLKRVIVSDGSRLAMEPSLEAALAAVFEGTKLPAADVAPESPPRPSPAMEGAPTDARAALDSAERALATGDWDTFGKAMQRLKGLIGP